MAFCLVSIRLSAQVALPYVTDFSPVQGYSDEGVLSTPWATTSNTIVTANDVAHEDQLSVRVPSASPEHVVSLSFDSQSSSIVFIDYYMQFTASSVPVLPLLTTPETTAVLALRPYGSGFGEWVVLDGDGLGSGVWKLIGDIVGLDENSLSSWHHITFRMDLSSNEWDVYVDELLYGANIGFAEGLTSSEAINLYGNSSGVAYLDSVSISLSNPLFTDVDVDGIEDTYELSNGMDIGIDDRNLDLDLDGITNIEEYILGLLAGNRDTDGDGLGDGFEVAEGYSPLGNDFAFGAFGDQDGDRLANQTEREVGLNETSADDSTNLLTTSTDSTGELAITLIGHGTFTIDELSEESPLSN